MFKNKKIYNYSVVFIALFILFSCDEPNEQDIEFKNESISGIVDSIAVYHDNFPNGKNHLIWINEKKYHLYSKYYASFILYVEKGDSISKKFNQWDINVYKKQNGKLITKYFIGAHDYWD